MTKQHTALVAVLAVALAGPALAQEQATVLKRDGSRVSGRFEAWNRDNNTIYLRVSLDDQRIIPLGDIAVVEVAGNADNLPAGEIATARGSDHVLLLRNGDLIRGRLLNIEGGEGSGNEGEPRTLSFKPNDAGERRTRFSDVRRLYLGNFPAALAPASTQAPAIEEPEVPAGAIRVAGNGRWVATNVTVRRTDRVAFTVAGQVQLSVDPEDLAGPDGSLKGRYAPNAPAPNLLAGSLIGRIGNGPPFGIGSQRNALPMPGDGQLFLAVNDGNVGDNQGAFVVTLRVTRGQRESEVVRVAATVAWNDTGIDVLDGTDVYFKADGFVGWGPNRRDGAAGEEDSPVNLNRPLPHRPAAGLIGKIGESSTEYFFIGGNQNAIRMRATGRLFLGINDDYLEDNSGTLTVTVYGTVKLTLNGQAPPPMGR